MTGRDALEFIAVGAAAVQVGTASFMRPRAAIEVLEEMESVLRARGVRRLADFRGSLSFQDAEEDAAGEAKQAGGATRRVVYGSGTPAGRAARRVAKS